jgi:hypothetical protein
MKPVKQEDGLGCAVACVAFVLDLSYSKTLELFEDGKRRAREEANFYCSELVKILNEKGLNYSWKKLNAEDVEAINRNLSIVFIETSHEYPYGHFLARCKDKWMDPWINLPDTNREAGFRDKLPGIPIYIVHPL